MKKVSMKDLKGSLSAAVAEAEAGRTVVITRHNEAVAQLVPARSSHVHQGDRAGSAGIQSAIKRGTRGQYLEVLIEDRGGR